MENESYFVIHFWWKMPVSSTQEEKSFITNILSSLGIQIYRKLICSVVFSKIDQLM